MGQIRRSIGLGFSAVALVGMACGRDFDGLFADVDAGAAPAPTSSGAGSEASAPIGDAGIDAADASTGGCVPNGTCQNSQGCDGGTCSPVCSGCGCNCGTQACPSGEANKRCDGQCTAGAICSVDCSLAGPCQLTCDDCTSSSFRCAKSAGDCSTKCSPGSTCEQTCASSTAKCEMTCPTGATCQLECAGSGAPCNLTCDDGSLKNCGNGVFTCNKPCPP